MEEDDKRMSDDQVGCEWVSVSSGTGLPGLSRTKAVKRLCVCAYSNKYLKLLNIAVLRKFTRKVHLEHSNIGGLHNTIQPITLISGQWCICFKSVDIADLVSSNVLIMPISVSDISCISQSLP